VVNREIYKGRIVHTEVDNVVSLYRGMIKLARKYGTAIVGGDTSGAPQLVINITILGSAVGGNILTRSAAKAGDKVAVTGYLGASNAGLEMLTKKLSFDKKSASDMVKAFLTPEPRVMEGRILIENGVKSAIDISDGLIADLGHICRMSKVSARIETDKVPVHPAVKKNFRDDALEMALSGGEDYELLFTAGDDIITAVKKEVSCPVTVIGEVTAGQAGKIMLLDSKGHKIDLPRKGWEHFIK